jgi:hypothetical protein
VSGGGLFGLRGFCEVEAFLGGNADGFHVDFFSKVPAMLYFYK